jgi:hypothetical protein
VFCISEWTIYVTIVIPGSILLKLAIDPGRREPAKVLRAEFEGSVGKLLPLLERIRQTDELIDAVVYRLYGADGGRDSYRRGKEIAKSHLLQQ